MQIWHLESAKEEKLADTLRAWYCHAKQKKAEYEQALADLNATFPALNPDQQGMFCAIIPGCVVHNAVLYMHAVPYV